jgi:hypothetical protein
MAKVLYRARGPELMESGIKPVPHPLDVDLWIDSENVIFMEGGPQKQAGWVSPFAFTPSAPVRGMGVLQDSANVQRLFFGDWNSLFHYNGVSLTTVGTGYNGRINQTSAAPATAWSFAPFGNWMIATDGDTNIQIWKGSGSFGALQGTPPTRAQIALKKGPHLLLINNSLGPSNIAWCGEDNPEDWDFNNPASAAGNLNVREMEGPLVAATMLGDRIALFGKAELYFLTYLGAPFYFGVKKGLTGIGAVGKMAVCSANNLIYGVDDKGIWATDGVSFNRIDSPAIREWIEERIDTTQLTKVVVCHNSAVQEVQFWFPGTSGEASFGVGYRYKNNSWAKYPYGRSGAVQQPGVFKYHITCHPTSGVKFQGSLAGVDDGNSAMPAWVQTRPLDLDAPHYIKYVDIVMTLLRRQTGAFRVELGWQEDLDDEITWTSPQEIGEGVRPAYFRESGRFISLRFGSVALGADWALGGFDVWGETNGAIL